MFSAFENVLGTFSLLRGQDKKLMCLCEGKNMKFNAYMGRASAHGLERECAGACHICIRFASPRSRYVLKAAGALP